MSNVRIPECAVVDLGLVDYDKSWDLQRTLARARRSELIPDTLILCEHPHTFTVGRSGKREDVLLNDATLTEIGFSVRFVDRGGQVTYHGPGQLVGYPIIDLRQRGNDVLKYLRSLEQVIISTLAKLGIYSRTIPGFTGVWVEEEKIAAIGIKVAQGVTTHGFALNVNNDLSPFEYIIPCGITDKGVTSIEAILEKSVSLETVSEVLVRNFADQFGVAMHPVDIGSLCANFA